MELAVEPQTVLRQAIGKMRMAIVEGVFKPGERLVEVDLCERLKVSRPLLREALRTLEAERLIVSAPNKGPSVASLTWEAAEQIYAVRALLEGEAAALCARYAKSSDLESMKEALAGFAAAVEANEAAKRISYTADFYQALQSGSGNMIIEEVLQGLLARINFLRTRSMAAGERAKQSLKEMRAIHKAIAARDPEAARAASALHIANASLAAKMAFQEKKQ